MPLSFETFQEEGFYGSSSFWFSQDQTEIKREDLSYVVSSSLPEPTSVLDALKSPSPLSSTTTTTLSSSHGGSSAITPTPTLTTNDDKCTQMCLDTSSPEQEQSILTLMMDPSSGFCFDPGFGFGSGSGSSYSFPFQEENQQITHPPAKRFNSGSVFPFSDPDPGQFHVPISPPRIAMNGHLPWSCTDTWSVLCINDVITQQLFNAAELLSNNQKDQTTLAQGILARLNHHLNNSPFQRTALYITEALLSLTHNSLPQPEINLIHRISAYKAFSETSPFLPFVNFTTNQSILESCNNNDRIHIIDFDVGFGGKWSSLIHELSTGRRRRNRVSLKITVFTPPLLTVSEEFEIRFTEENLKAFAGEVKIPFEIEILSVEMLLNQVSLCSMENEAIAVNLPLSSVSSVYLPLILRFIKELSPNVVVCSDRGCERNDALFAGSVIHALEYYTTLLESFDVNKNQDSLSVERFWVRPCIEKMLMRRYRWVERTPPWRSLFAQCGFSPVSLSHIAGVQAECLVQRSLVRGFHVETRLSSLVLCWQRKELVTVSVWKC